MSEDEERFMRRLKKHLSNDQISAVAAGPDSFFERLAPYVAMLAKEQGIGQTPIKRKPQELPMY